MATLLIADDNEDHLRGICDALQGAGYEIIEARDGNQVVEIYAEKGESIDAVVLDYNLPKLNGDECLERIKENQGIAKIRRESGKRKIVPVLGFSIYVSPEPLKRFKKEVDAYIQAPFIYKDLIKAVSKVLSKG